MRKWVIYGLGIFFCLLLLSLPSLMPCSLSHRVKLESYNLLQEGMTEEEVIAILGIPAGDYTTMPYDCPHCVHGLPPAIGNGPITAASVWKEWKVDGVEVTVVFDQGKLSNAFYVWTIRKVETFPEMVRRWLRL